MRSAAAAAVSSLWLVWAATPAAAQDAHYWTYGYGPIGQLTEGALVGGVSDLSATYYNPGALALIERPRFLVGLTSIELANIDVPGVGGTGLDADQLVFDIVPSMVAGQVGGDGGRDRFAFSFLSRHDSDWDILLHDEHVVAGSPEADARFGRIRQRLVEYWAGGTWSRRVSERLAFGVSPYVAYRAQRRRRALTSSEVSASGSGSVFVADEREYNHVRALLKAGLAWRSGAFELGTTVTTPGVRLYGSGKVRFDASATGDVRDPFVSASVQEGLEASYHSPWAVAAGATWRSRGGAIHATAEWFSAVGAYEVLSPEPAPVSGRSETVPLTYRGQADDVACYGLALEKRAGALVLYGALAHNESAYVAGRDSFAAWDLTDATLGFTLDTSRALVALGASYAWGSKPLQQEIVPPGVSQPASVTEAHFSRWTFSVGASFH
jgi:hypothetical protein